MLHILSTLLAMSISTHAFALDEAMIQQVQRSVASQHSYYESIVKGVQQTSVSTPQAAFASPNPTPQANIQQTRGCSMGRKEGFRILVSFSMPSAELVQLDKIARRIGARLLLRGLKNNSFKETVEAIRAINPQGMVLDIDPQAFAQFAITQVPSFILIQGTQYDKLVGNVSVAHVLDRFASEGSLPHVAKHYRERLSHATS